MVTFDRKHYDGLSDDRIRAFRKIADELGKDHPITRMMGTLAWGRFKAEQGPGGTLRTAVEAYGFLNGYFDALNHWARDNDRDAQRVMLRHWPSGMARVVDDVVAV